MKKTLVKIYERTKRLGKRVQREVITPKIPINPDGKVYINLGCGNDSGPEFINVDVLKLPNIHYIHDIANLPFFKDETADMIYASHVVEHIPREKFSATIREWQRVLKKGGTLRISVPDFDRLIEIYQGNGKDVTVVQDQVLGQKPPYDNHYTLWNFRHAQKTFSELGFTNIRLWNPLTAEHHNFTDRSTRKIKTEKGDVYLSLNVEMIKV